MILVQYTFFPDRIEDDMRFENLLLQLPQKSSEAVTRYKRRESRWASLLGKLLIQNGLAKLGIARSHSLADVQYSAYNRPYFGHSSIDFNISHSGRCVIAAISTCSKLGIDIEHIRPIEIEAYFAAMLDEEKSRIQQSADPLTAFYKYWTEKECVMKANGKGLNIPVKSFSVKGNHANLHQTDWHVRKVFLSENYVCHLATDQNGRDFRISPRYVSF